MKSKPVLLEKKLRSLGYTFVFHQEDFDLINTVLTDLIKVSEAYQQLKRMRSQSVSETNLSKQFGGKYDIDKLIDKENDTLHEELIELKTSIDRKEMNFKFQVKSFEDKLFDYRSVIDMKNKQIDNLERDNQKLKLRVKEYIIDSFSVKKSKFLQNDNKQKTMEDFLKKIDNSRMNERIIAKLEEDKLNLEGKVRNLELKLFQRGEAERVEERKDNRKDEEIIRLKLKCAIIEKTREEFRQLSSIKNGYEKKLFDLQEQYNILLSHYDPKTTKLDKHEIAVKNEMIKELNEEIKHHQSKNAQLNFELNDKERVLDENHRLDCELRMIQKVS